MKTGKVFLILMGVGFASTVPAMGQTPINSCSDANIMVRGNYVLNVDLECGVSINASNVSIQLNGHKLTGSGPDAGVGIAAGFSADHIVISGPGLVRYFSAGVSGSFCTYCQIRSVSFAQNGIGITFGNSSFLTIESNLLVDNGSTLFDGDGVRMGIVSNSSFAFNEIVGNSRYGLSIRGGTGNTINNNVISGNGASGLLFGFVSAFNVGTTRVYGNTLNGNGESGIKVQVSGSFFNDSDNKFFSNSAKGNKVFDLEDATPCTKNGWGDNVFFTTNQACIR